MDPFFIWLEETSLSIWVRESPSMFAFPGILVVHTWGMAFLAGSTSAFSLRVLGFAGKVPTAAMLKFAPVVWFGFILNLVSGLLLLMGYPTKALTNPVFYLKLTTIALALLAVRALSRRVASSTGQVVAGWKADRVLAGLTLGFWVVSVTAGRLLAYTHSRLLASGF
jgi:hypothetical protein